jgi:hypothetical protein
MYNKFQCNLSQVNIATPIQRKKECWDIEGIIKDKSNQLFKFDLRPLKNNTKGGFFNSKADKMVFDIKDQWIIVDMEELIEYLKDNNLKKVKLEDLISKLDWNIILPK